MSKLARTEKPPDLKRITVLTGSRFERELYAKAVELEAVIYVCMHCSGRLLDGACDASVSALPLVRVEMLLRPVGAEQMLDFLRESQNGLVPLTVTIDPCVCVL